MSEGEGRLEAQLEQLIRAIEVSGAATLTSSSDELLETIVEAAARLFGAAAGPQARRMVLIGSEGVIFPEGGRVAIRKNGSKEVKYVDVVDKTPKAVTAKVVGSAQDGETYQQYLLFAKTVREGQAPLVAPQAAKETAKIILLAEKSLREHRVLNWNDLPA